MIALQDFKQTLAHLAGAVTVITTCDAHGQPWGFTATAFCSLSLDPPLVLCCLSHIADCYKVFVHGNRFAVNILSAQQRDLSQRFASKGAAKYRGIRFEAGKLGLPLLPGALASLECATYAIYPGGDHSILVGLVEHGVSAEGSRTENPLLYYTQAYGTFMQLLAEDEQRRLTEEFKKGL
jgi:flavin reductase ActVB